MSKCVNLCLIFHTMLRIFGEYEVAIDTKGRFLLPAALRKQMPEDAESKFFIRRGFEKCLVLYPLETWNEIAEKLDKINDFNPKAREFRRRFLNGATPSDTDTAGRILLSKMNLEYAGINIKGDMIVSGQGNKIELWDKDAYYKHINNEDISLSDLAAEVAGQDFFI